MNSEITSAIITIVVVGFSRWLSSREHKQTKQQITEIHIKVNGELERRLEQAREEGRNENKKTG